MYNSRQKYFTDYDLPQFEKNQISRIIKIQKSFIPWRIVKTKKLKTK